MVRSPSNYNLIYTLFLYLCWTILTLAFYFKHTRALEWIGLGGLAIAGFVGIKNNFLYFREKGAVFLISLLGLFLCSLFVFVLISPFRLASLEAFLLNYFFQVGLFLYFLNYNHENESLFFSLYLVFFAVTVLSFIYYLFYVLVNCDFSFPCFLKASSTFINSSYIKGIVVTSFPLTLSFFLSMGLFFRTIGTKKSYYYLFISFFSLVILIYLGRRAALLGILISLLLLAFLSKEKVLKKGILSLSFILLLSLIVILNTSIGEEILIKGRDNLQLLLSFEEDKIAQSGSLGQRFYIWSIYIKKSLEEPFSGTGLGRRVQKRVLAETNKRALNLEHAHNIFLNIALQAGVHTAFLFLLFYLLTLYRGYQVWKGSKEDPFLGALLAFLIAYLIMSLFEGAEEGTRFVPFWIASGFIWKAFFTNIYYDYTRLRG